jgi:L-2-hydroxyglutarate oxidase
MINGDVECGPNAVLGLSREGYEKFSFDWQDTKEIFGFAGSWKLFRKHWRPGMAELWRSLSKAAFVRALQRLMPDLAADEIEPAECGIRAQALKPDGGLVDDFELLQTGRQLHVLNAPSPAATASLAIADYIVGRLEA